MTTIAEDFLMLALDDETGKSTFESTSLSYGLAGAVLMELAIAGRVRIAERGEDHAGRVLVVDASPVGEPILDHALAELADDKPRAPQSVVTRLSKKLRDRVLAGLESRRIVRRDEGHVLGIFPRTLWPAMELRQEKALRDRLHAVLVLGQAPDERTAAIVGLLVSTKTLTTVMRGQDRRQVRDRAKQIVTEDWASTGVRKAMEEIDSAVMASVIAATSVAGS